VRSFLALLLAAAPFAAGCSKSSSKTVTPPAPTPTSSVLSTIAVGGTAGTFVSSALPTGTTTAPTVVASDSFVVGSSALLTVTVPDTTVALLVAASGHTGYYRAAVTAPMLASARARAAKYASAGVQVLSARPSAVQGYVDLVVTVGIIAGQTTAPLVFMEECSHSHSLGASHTFTASQRASGSGQLQFSLSWSAPVDLDLHVQVPVGADSVDIYYANRNAGGGSLDLDSNPACYFDYVDNENITWGSNVPAHGTYKVRVDLWSACSITEPIPWVLTIRECGAVVQTVHGVSQVAEADAAGAFGGKVVSTLAFNGCGAPDNVVRTVTENCRTLKFETSGFEES